MSRQTGGHAEGHNGATQAAAQQTKGISNKAEQGFFFSKLNSKAVCFICQKSVAVLKQCDR